MQASAEIDKLGVAEPDNGASFTTTLRVEGERGAMASLTERRVNWLFAAGLVGTFALLMALEAISNENGMTPVEFVFEALEFGLMIAIAVGIIHLFQRMRTKDIERQELVRDLESVRAQGCKWRDQARQYLDGLRSAMDEQFGSWGMTNAERDIGLLILKGLSHKEIAKIRGTSEATVRQQAQSIYEKSSLPGKAAFLSFFLEDLFAPDAGRD